MNTIIKSLCLTILVLLLPVQSATAQEGPLSAQLEQIKQSQNKTTMMQSKSWNTPEKTEDSEDAPEDETAEDGTHSSKDAEEQQIWNKYKAIPESQDDQTEGALEEQEEESAPDDESTKAEDAQTPEPPSGIAAILERYKKAQEEQGPMHSRSLGSID